MIPTKYLCKMGDYDIIYDGVPLKAKVIDNYKVVNQLIPHYFGSEDVIGLDIKNFTRNNMGSHRSFHLVQSSYDILVLCGISRCLIIHSDFMMEQLPSLKEFLEDSNICFVRPSILKDNSSSYPGGVAVCELAARVLKKSKLKKESSLEVISREVGVSYQDVYGSIVLNSDSDKILTQEQVEMVAYRAFTCHRIGSKLLSSLE
ncbi:hypothetical protein BVRB_4g080300 [Beta vulgaris subsp. vulgaris]|nr:hypothetical protein BVRB_4g080300 [Beta vulgaris subsp. vulgaris]